MPNITTKFFIFSGKIDYLIAQPLASVVAAFVAVVVAVATEFAGLSAVRTSVVV
jgi:hypothetical protein